MPAPRYHPATRLRHHGVHVDLSWDGSIRLTPHAELLTPQGQGTGRHEHWTTRIPPHDARWGALMAALEPAILALHEALGVDPPPPSDVPVHLHPQGDPALTERPDLAAPATPGRGALRAHLVRVKEMELSADAGVPVQIPAHLHPLPDEKENGR